MPKNKPGIVTVPSMNYIAVRGQGDPNQEDGEHKQSIGFLYGIAFTIKINKMGAHRIDGYFDCVVPPLEGFWWQDGIQSMDYARKEDFQFLQRLLTSKKIFSVQHFLRSSGIIGEKLFRPQGVSAC